MEMDEINWLAVAAAGLSAFILGGIWYSPILFGKAWMKENKFSPERVRSGNKGRIFGWAFVLTLIMAANLGIYLADTPKECVGNCAQKTDLSWGTIAGFLAGIWGFCGIAVVALFELRTTRYILINGSYVLLALTLMGAIIGVWR